MDTILNLLTGGLASGIIGAAGGIITAIIQQRGEAAKMSHELAMAPLRFGHELKLREMDLAQVQAEAAAKVEIAREEGEAQAAVAQLGALAGSYQHDAQLHASGSWLMRNLIDPFAAGVRPGLSLWAAAVVSFAAWIVFPVLRTEIPKDPAKAWEVAGRILAMAEMIFAWWFAARMTSARGKR